MTTPDDLIEVISRGKAARDTLESPAFLTSVDNVSTYHMAAIAACPATDEALSTLRYHHGMAVALAEIVADLQGYAQAGAAAERVVNVQMGVEDEPDEY